LGELFLVHQETGGARFLVPGPLRLSGHDIVLPHASCIEGGPTARAILNEPLSWEEFRCFPIACSVACVEDVMDPKGTNKENEEHEREKED
jgi:hypothetical protein